MPELPEVETIRRGLEQYLVGHTIRSVEIKLAKIVSGNSTDIIGATCVGVARFGKGLVIQLDNGYTIAIHVKMTGQLVYQKREEGEKEVVRVEESITGGKLPNKWTHVIFHLDKGARLYYNDFRQFGWIKLVKQEDVPALAFFKALGPEFLKDLTRTKFLQILGVTTPIKTLIMNQNKMSGLGNIYANDGLYLAKIDPRRPAKDLSKEEALRLFTALETVLQRGIASGGASKQSFVNVLGQKGTYQHHFLVYGRDKEPCPTCGKKIEKITLGGRGTFFCPICQQ